MTSQTRSSAIADKPRASLTNRAMLVCKVVEVWQQARREGGVAGARNDVIPHRAE